MLLFPVNRFGAASLKVTLVGAGESGGQSIGGVEAIGDFSQGGLWHFEYGEVALPARADFITWRAFASATDNGTQPVIVPVGDRGHAPVISPAVLLAFPDDDIWDDTDTWEPVEVEINAAADASAGDTTLTLDVVSTPIALIGSELFSILTDVGWRMHQIVRLDGDVAEIRPPLREDVVSGTALNFEAPRCTCRLDGDADAILEMLKFGKGGPITFVESFPNFRPGTVYAHDTRKFRLIDHGTSWLVPRDWIDDGAWFMAIGGGAGGTIYAAPANAKSGGGAAYAYEDRTTHFHFKPFQRVAIHIGPGGAASGPADSPKSGGDTWLGSSNKLSAACVLSAAGGFGTGGGGQGGTGTSSKGLVTFKGGNGGGGFLNAASGVGGGGAAGPGGDGATAQPQTSSSDPSATGNGGTAGGGAGGAGGLYQSTGPGLPGGDGTDFTSGAPFGGSGGGGGSGQTNDVHALDDHGGNGGLYGGGGAMGNLLIYGGRAGKAGRGCLVISWTGDATVPLGPGESF